MEPNLDQMEHFLSNEYISKSVSTFHCFSFHYKSFYSSIATPFDQSVLNRQVQQMLQMVDNFILCLFDKSFSFELIGHLMLVKK